MGDNDLQKQVEIQNEQQMEEDLYEEIEYEEEEEEEIEYEDVEEVKQYIEQEKRVLITEPNPIQNEKEIDKDKDKEEPLDDLGIPPRNCVSPSLVNPFLPPIKPVLWTRLLNDWQIDWRKQLEQDYPLSEEYVPLLKQDSGSKYYNIQQEPDV
ncbi:MAG: hypothetical protein EZS28_042340 [Streblomastix strix]|uniref:Uncharacterized protein n=1 Tax=Streblomastix strix TaxID=222440 RepID=A0A5J4TW61_9EUKA|nr:MAG: hypothetical protein EZS28_042340 [Streblomastix strix]